MPRRRRAVALLIETSNAYARGLLEGITAYIREHDPWSIYLPEQQRGAKPPAWLRNWKGDGLVARIETAEIARAVRATRLPVVDVSAARRVSDVPWVETDDAAIARLAVQHLIERGFRQLAFCGDPAFNWSRWREEPFVAAAQAAGGRCEVFHATPRNRPGYSWNRDQRRLARWIERLPKPVGVLAAYDILAQRILDICRDLDLAVPEQVAVLGVDNDELLCNLCSPPLSSVAPDCRRTGYEAAALLDQLMAGRRVPAQAHLLQPLGIVTRQSTDVLAIDDPHIAAAVRFIREHACDGVNAADVLPLVPWSRRVFEARFRKLLGQTPHDLIVRHRLERVRRLLVETSLPLEQVADRAGFTHVEYLIALFRQRFGQPPGAYRQQMQGG